MKLVSAAPGDRGLKRHRHAVVEPGDAVGADIDYSNGRAGAQKAIDERGAKAAGAAGDQRPLAAQPKPVRHRAGHHDG